MSGSSIPGLSPNTVNALKRLFGGGGSAALNRVDASSSGQPIDSTFHSFVTGWTQDSVVGSDVTVNGDGIHFDCTSGVYLAQVDLTVNGWTGLGFVKAIVNGADGAFADSGAYLKGDLDGSGDAALHGMMLFAIDGGTTQFSFQLFAGGSLTGKTVFYMGADIVKLGG